MRLIDADALKESIDEHVYLVNHGFNESEYGITQYGIHQIIDDAPTIDAVPVIRCKDCRWFINKECAIYCLSSAHEETFCSYAEPKDSTAEVRRQLKEQEQRKEMERKK